MYRVYVQAQDGKPLEPTTRFGWVRRAIRTGRAVVVQRKPFIIRLTYAIVDPVTKEYIGSTDPGRTNIGNAVINIDDGKVVYTDKVETCNRAVPKHMSERRAARQASRRGERLARKRLAKTHGMLSTKLEEGRLIPGCEKLTQVKDIINTEARFKNRKRHSNMGDVISSECGWLTPTAKQLVETHLNHVDQICRLYPVLGWCFELNKFAFMKMDDGTVYGVDYQNGRLKGFRNAKEYVYALQEGRCAVCGAPLDDVHHVIPRSENGSDSPDNLIGLCNECHHKVHTGELDISKAGEIQRYGALSVLNQAVPYILLGLVERFGKENVYVCSGRDTALARDMLHLDKDHDLDAVAIACACTGIEPVMVDEESFSIRQFRRNDRARIKCQKERTYKQYADTNAKGSPEYKIVAKNRRPREEQQKSGYPALSQWFEERVNTVGYKQAQKERGRLKVTASSRSYNTPGRVMPGAAFKYKNRCYVMTGQLTGGRYYRALGQGSKNFPAKDCKIIVHNTGLVYI